MAEFIVANKAWQGCRVKERKLKFVQRFHCLFAQYWLVCLGILSEALAAFITINRVHLNLPGKEKGFLGFL